MLSRILNVLLFCAVVAAGCTTATGIPRAKRPTVFQAGAAASSSATWSDDDCREVKDKYDTASLVSKIFIGLGGASAVTTPLPQWGESARWSIAAGASALTITGGAVMWWAESKQKDFIEHCDLVPDDSVLLDSPFIGDGGVE